MMFLEYVSLDPAKIFHCSIKFSSKYFKILGFSVMIFFLLTINPTVKLEEKYNRKK